MTTFTTEDRILAEKNGSFTINAEGGTVTTGFKELTDDEIMFEWEKSKDEVDFARAILKKAQNG